jgi:F-type H+-transporting ATPase subunit epsilon
MAKSFKVNIITPEKTAFESDAESVILPGSEGYLGIWANHAPLVTGILPGVVALKESGTGKTRFLSVSGGFVEVSGNVVNIMCDSCERAGEIDRDRAKAALERAKQKLRSSDANVDKERARLAVERAQARIHAAYLREGHRD